jgi:hypothetical protein
MELIDYTIKRMYPEPDIPLVPYSGGDSVIRSVFQGRPAAVLSYNLPFVYHEFKLLCLITIFKNEGVSFTNLTNVSSEDEYYEHYKGLLTDYRIAVRSARVTTIEMTIMITETEVRKASKFTAASA